MAITHAPHAAIRGVYCAVPCIEVNNEQMQLQMGSNDISSVEKITGVYTRRLAAPEMCASDLSVAAANALLDDIGWDRSSVDALIFISQTPDYVLPATSTLIQERLGLSQECAAFDVNLGCSGYIYGLWLASSLLCEGEIERILLLVGDTCSHFVAPTDRATAPLFGDAAAATAIEYSSETSQITYVLGTDGRGGQNLIIPGGGFRQPLTQQTIDRQIDVDNTLRNTSDLKMNGAEIFNFTLDVVPKLIYSTLEASGLNINEVDYFIFHQANQFIIKQISKRFKVSDEKIPLSLAQFGNTSSASIPVTLVSQLSAILNTQSFQMLLVGFGVGYSWGAAALRLGPITALGMVEI